MKSEIIWNCPALPESTGQKLKQALLFSALLLAALTGSSSTYADNQPTGNAYESYKHSRWWIAGISAASIAGMTSNTFAEDKKRHFSISIALGAASEFGLRKLKVASDSRWKRIALATGAGLVPGIIKEMTDDRFDKEDLLADVIGSFTGALLSDLVQGPVDTGPQYGVVVGVDKVGLAVNYPF
ncbi:hypothetical protein NX722_10970 [Endozoicomonas gorgoniicola]|uniref:Lipoprotein n=1 Tax=Endozoicomonas gorgoniicola TaxID=1234144 RepID=A0ABT3MUV9_9GAMM|nr:hypothetical protein [Endozoicomonas gorgoniicola]MCW7553148.1 hypothetical protein [Endozoicomonas gorgoniicola]